MASGSVAVASSPVFSPTGAPSIFGKTPPPDVLKLNVHAQSLLSPSSSSSASPPSPLALRLQRQHSGLMDCSCRDEPSVSSPPPQAQALLVQTQRRPQGKMQELLKRKRPARISVPMPSLNLFAAGSKAADAAAEVEPEAVEAAGDGYSVCCKRGKRGIMEDRYSAVVNLQGDSRQAFFGVYDGHGGVKAAEFAAKNLAKNIMDEVSRSEGKIDEAMRGGYLTTDLEFLEEDVDGGTCCVTALVHNGNLVISNAGDCRAVMSRGGIAEALTSDHRPSREDERNRIETLGGYVDCCRGVWRIQGSLAVSRGIGDKHLKQWVIAEPETKIVKIDPECEFLILASDGLWDKVSNQEAVDIVRALCINVDKLGPFLACKNLAELSVGRGSVDDVTVMIIQLSRFVS